MIPKPISEAWLLCALKQNPYQNCKELEHGSGSRRSPNSLKKKLNNILGQEPTSEMLSELVMKRKIDHSRIDMPSFNAFKNRLLEVLK